MKFYGQFIPPVDKVIFDRYFNSTFNGTSIECGAFDGVTENCTKFFEENFKWKTINIEPLPNVYKKLVHNRPNSINLNIALSDSNQEKTIYNYKHPSLNYDWGNASISHTDEHKRQLEELCGKDTIISHKVQCKTYNTIIKELGLTKLDLFVLDVEGHEKEVIKGMKGCDILPSVFVIEHGHRKPEDIANELQILNCKYRLDHISHVNSYFVREDF